MTEPANDARFLEMFPAWLSTLGEDANNLGKLVTEDGQDDDVKRYVVGGLNYLFKSLDLIPDGIDDIGFLDDAFVLRVSAHLAVAEKPEAKNATLERLAEDAKPLKEFMGEDYDRLETYVKGLKKGAARGRTVDEVMDSTETRNAFAHEVTAWSQEYQSPSFTRDPKTLIKLKAFLNAKLP
ncbi:MAG TPA: YkvA family protein [Polyangiaceae bacterium]